MSLRTESMEWSQTISHLAAANQQLAAAHNLTLNHIQWLFTEFRRPQQRPCVPEISEKKPNVKTSFSKSRARDNNEKFNGKVHTIFGPNKKSTRTRKIGIVEKSSDVDKRCENVKTLGIENDLKREIQNLNNLKLESQTENERLMLDLERKKLSIERLTQDYENSQRECRKKEKSLEHLTEILERSKSECTKLLAELETFQCERKSAERTANEENNKLRATLAEREEERKKQLVALDEAKQRIRDLELVVQSNDGLFAESQNQTSKTNAGADKSEYLESNTMASSSSITEEFKKELTLKREARQRAIAAISLEMDRLKAELEAEKVAHSETTEKLNDSLKKIQTTIAAESKTDDNENFDKTGKNYLERMEALRLSDLLKISDEIINDLWLQLERMDDLRFQLENDPEEHRLRICSLKRLSEETRATLRSRKQQVNLLKDRLAQILVRLGDRSFLEKSDDIRKEVERQIEDISRSRNLCDERLRILAELKDHSIKETHELKLKLESSNKNNQILEDDLRKTEDKLDTQDTEILNLESQLGLAKADCRDLQNQMSVINSLFTQMLLSASSAEMDLDRLTRLLQENHDLISGVAKENGTEAAALPKLLLDLIEQVDGRTRENEEKKEDLQEENIAHNLPKVWRVLLELLSCHAAESTNASSSSTVTESAPDSCYKSVDTPTGPRLVISVSKTYIRLKELILEKKHLEKEMNRMKQLNNHLENKLSEQEKRLSTVSDELSKTWNIVGRMQAQHQQLHTHEKILRYELQQKRKMLQELKQELEYCREKWESARQKNTNTEIEWRSLRREFAARKALTTHSDSFNNSGESGFSDEREEESDEDDDDEDVGKRLRPVNSRRRSRKDDSRAITPDTESEQPTDTEFSESKTASSTSGQCTPTPEPEAELEHSDTIEEDSLINISAPNNSLDSTTEVFDPLDKALTTVIESLIEADDFQGAENFENENPDSETIVKNTETDELTKKEDDTKNETKTEEINIESRSELKLNVEEDSTLKVSEIVSPISVFTIGPVPMQAITPKNVQFSNPLVIGPSNRINENVTKSNANLTNIIDSAQESSSVSYNTKESRKSSDTNTSRSNVTDNFSDIPNTSCGTKNESTLETVEELPNWRSNESFTSAAEQVGTLANLKLERKESAGCDKGEVLPNTEVLDARAARLKNLEEQAEWLVKKVNDTNRKSSALSSRLEELHETYSSTPVAPPMPDVLPAFKIRTEINEIVSSRDENNETIDNTDVVGENFNDDRS